MGVIRDRLGQTREAEAALQRSCETYARLMTESPATGAHRSGLARALNQLALLYSAEGRGSEAEAAYRAALTHHRKLVADFPDVQLYQHNLGGTFNNLGSVLKRLGRSSEAEEAYREGIAVFAHLVSEFPTAPEHRAELGRTYGNLGILVLPMPGRSRDAGQDSPGRSPEAVEILTRAVDIYKGLAAEFPTSSKYLEALGAHRDHLAGAQRDAGRHAEAEEMFKQALATRSNSLRSFPSCRNTGVVASRHTGS